MTDDSNQAKRRDRGDDRDRGKDGAERNGGTRHSVAARSTPQVDDEHDDRGSSERVHGDAEAIGPLGMFFDEMGLLERMFEGLARGPGHDREEPRARHGDKHRPDNAILPRGAQHVADRSKRGERDPHDGAVDDERVGRKTENHECCHASTVPTQPVPNLSRAEFDEVDPRYDLRVSKTTEPISVLIVEDDAKLASLVQRGIESQRWLSDIADRGDVALKMLTPPHRWDVVVLDRTLPGTGGMRVCRAMRELGDMTPIIMLTARAAVDERIEGLDAGANDYLTKPFALKELHARIRALLRDAPSRSSSPSSLGLGPLALDEELRELLAGDIRVQLRPQESLFVALLLRARGRPVSREQLRNALWPEDEFTTDNQLDVLVGRVRRRIAPFGHTTITTDRGFGYRIQVES